MLRQKLARFQLPIFFLLAYVITWSAQIPAYLYAHNHGYTLTNEQNTLHLINLFRGELDPGLTPYLLIAIFAFGPSVAGVVVTGIFYGRAGLRDLWSRVTRARVDSRWILIVLLLPVALALITLAVTFLAGGLQPINFVFLAPLSLIPLVPAVHADLHRPGRGGGLARVRPTGAPESPRPPNVPAGSWASAGDCGTSRPCCFPRTFGASSPPVSSFWFCSGSPSEGWVGPS